MPYLTAQHVAYAIAHVEQLSPAAGEALMDQLHREHPHLLVSVVMLNTVGARMEHIDVALRVLLICHVAVGRADHRLQSVTLPALERCRSRVVGRARFTENLDDDALTEAVQQQIDAHPEPFLLAAAYQKIRAHDLESVRTEAEKHVLLTILTTVDAVAEAIRTTD